MSLFGLGSSRPPGSLGDSQVLTKLHKRLLVCTTHLLSPPVTFLTVWLSVPFSRQGQLLRRRCAPATGPLHRLPFCLNHLLRYRGSWCPLSRPSGHRQHSQEHSVPLSPAQHAPTPHGTPAFCSLPVLDPWISAPWPQRLGPHRGPSFPDWHWHKCLSVGFVRE